MTLEEAVEIVVRELDARGEYDLARRVAVATDPQPEERAEAARQVREAILDDTLRRLGITPR